MVWLAVHNIHLGINARADHRNSATAGFLVRSQGQDGHQNIKAVKFSHHRNWTPG